MAKIALEKYVKPCVTLLLNKYNEQIVIDHIDYLQTFERGKYKDLATRTIFDVCKSAYPLWRHLSEEDLNKTNNETEKSLYFKAFGIAYPRAWERLLTSYMEI